MTSELSIYLGDAFVGHLWLDQQRRFTFQYSANWTGNPSAIPLSISLPLRTEPFSDDAARPFFANLLPEADVRRAVARRLGISEQNDFALLEAIGGECAGAVSALPKGIPKTSKGEYRLISEDELHELVKTLPSRPFLAGEEGVRISLAGAQNKLPVYVEADSVYLPLGDFPSSHILKPRIRDLPGTVENEAFCMALAGHEGLAVPPSAIRRRMDSLYLVERYDRKREPGGKLARLHQEDFCQALGIAPDQKYESEGGPSLSRCFSLLKEVSIRPSADQKQLLSWVVFNYLTGNADAHAKNISLLLTEQGPVLAPFYDLMCTAVYSGVTDHLAMKIGGEKRPGWIHLRHWERFAEEVGIKPKLVVETLRQMAARISIDAESLAVKFHEEHGEPDVIKDILEVIRNRSHKALQITEVS